MFCRHFVDDYVAGFIHGARWGGATGQAVSKHTKIARSTVESYHATPRRPSAVAAANSVTRRRRHEVQIAARVRRAKKLVTTVKKVKSTRLVKKAGRPPKNPPPGWTRETYEETKVVLRGAYPSPQAVSRQLNQQRPGGRGQSPATVRRDVLSSIASPPLKCYRQQRRPELTAGQKAARVKFCKTMLDKGMKFACSILFSDEKWFDSNDHRMGYQYAGSRKDVRHVANAQHPPKLFVWAVIGVDVKRLVIIKEFGTDAGATPGLRMEQYCQECLTPHLDIIADRDRVFMQDGAGPHQKAEAWLKEKAVKQLKPWPSGSPDLNPLENLWDWLAKQVSERGPWGSDALADFVREEFDRMTQGHVDTYVLSFLRRCEQCVESEGDYVDA